MEPTPTPSLADEWDALRDGLERKRRPHPPRGELTEEELCDFLQQLRSDMYRARSQAGLTQEQVAAMMDTTRSAVSRLERSASNTPSLTTLCRYANAIDCRLRVEFVSRRPSPVWWEE